jgi:hypothetical protein
MRESPKCDSLTTSVAIAAVKIECGIINLIW